MYHIIKINEVKLVACLGANTSVLHSYQILNIKHKFLSRKSENVLRYIQQNLKDIAKIVVV